MSSLQWVKLRRKFKISLIFQVFGLQFITINRVVEHKVSFSSESLSIQRVFTAKLVVFSPMPVNIVEDVGHCPQRTSPNSYLMTFAEVKLHRRCMSTVVISDEVWLWVQPIDGQRLVCDEGWLSQRFSKIDWTLSISIAVSVDCTPILWTKLVSFIVRKDRVSVFLVFLCYRYFIDVRRRICYRYFIDFWRRICPSRWVKRRWIVAWREPRPLQFWCKIRVFIQEVFWSKKVFCEKIWDEEIVFEGAGDLIWVGWCWCKVCRERNNK